MYSNCWPCTKCGEIIGNFQVHQCKYDYYPLEKYKPLPYNINSSFVIQAKQLSEYSLQELLDELKRRKDQQDIKVNQLKEEIELQKQLEKMFPEKE
jgi:hypothetical protein